MKIQFLKAYEGDCILISYSSKDGNRNILIDGGIGNTYFHSDDNEYGDLFYCIEKLKKQNEKIDLLILTHIDDDHIGGILKWFALDKESFALIDKVWFNSAKLISETFDLPYVENFNYEPKIKFEYGPNLNTSARQGLKFESIIQEKNLWDRKLIKSPLIIENDEIKFEILSPNEVNLKALLNKWEKDTKSLYTSGDGSDYNKSLGSFILDDKYKEDKSIPNGSSIAFILTIEGKKMLFLGDSHPSVIVESLIKLNYSEENPLLVDLVKVSHHGSKSNNSVELLNLIKSPLFVILTNGDGHKHPHKQFVARLLKFHPNSKIFFNYPERALKMFLMYPNELRDFEERNFITFEKNIIE